MEDGILKRDERERVERERDEKECTERDGEKTRARQRTQTNCMNE